MSFQTWIMNQSIQDWCLEQHYAINTDFYWVFFIALITMTAYKFKEMSFDNLPGEDEKKEKYAKMFLDLTWYLLIGGVCYYTYLQVIR